MNYRDLNIHQRITARGNALKFYLLYRHSFYRDRLFERVSNGNPARFSPDAPFYAIQFKTNTFDLPFNYNPYA